MPLSEETVGGTSLPPTVTLTVKEATMGKVKLIVHECFAGKQKSERCLCGSIFVKCCRTDVEQIPRYNKRNRTISGFTLFPKGAEHGTSEEYWILGVGLFP